MIPTTPALVYVGTPVLVCVHVGLTSRYTFAVCVNVGLTSRYNNYFLWGVWLDDKCSRTCFLTTLRSIVCMYAGNSTSQISFTTGTRSAREWMSFTLLCRFSFSIHQTFLIMLMCGLCEGHILYGIWFCLSILSWSRMVYWTVVILEDPVPLRKSFPT